MATKFCEISTVDLTVTTWDKSTVEISQNFVAFSEYMSFNFVTIDSDKYILAPVISPVCSKSGIDISRKMLVIDCPRINLIPFYHRSKQCTTY